MVTLNHEFEVDDEHLAERINAIIEDYSRRELDALRVSCERLSVLLQHHAPQPHPAPHPPPHPTPQSTAKEA
jgi:aromatase/bifunctional cyclase/aromatase